MHLDIGLCASTSFQHVSHDHLWKGGRPACIPDGRHVLPKATCSVARLPYIAIWVEQGDLDGVIQPKSRCGESAIWYSLGTCRFRVTFVPASHRFDVSVLVVRQAEP
jgi:hypothetical protein